MAHAGSPRQFAHRQVRLGLDHAQNAPIQIIKLHSHPYPVTLSFMGSVTGTSFQILRI